MCDWTSPGSLQPNAESNLALEVALCQVSIDMDSGPVANAGTRCLVHMMDMRCPPHRQIMTTIQLTAVMLVIVLNQPASAGQL